MRDNTKKPSWPRCVVFGLLCASYGAGAAFTSAFLGHNRYFTEKSNDLAHPVLIPVAGSLLGMIMAIPTNCLMGKVQLESWKWPVLYVFMVGILISIASGVPASLYHATNTSFSEEVKRQTKESAIGSPGGVFCSALATGIVIAAFFVVGNCFRRGSPGVGQGDSTETTTFNRAYAPIETYGSI